MAPLIDPFNGRKAIDEKIIVTPLEPSQTFSDDPLRMMRAIRFAAQLNYTIVPETLAAMKPMCIASVLYRRNGLPMKSIKSCYVGSHQ